jgi:hypothetical protein
MIASAFFIEDRGRQLDSLAAVLDAGAQKQGPQVLFHSARADVQLSRNFLVAASLDQELQHLLIALGDFDLAEIHHNFSFPLSIKLV